jgi:hypothetical protein
MLRSILPSSHKRIPSNSQFEIIEKENLPLGLQSFQSSLTASLADALPREQRSQSRDEYDDGKAEQVSLNTAFDRLLVSALLCLLSKA